MIEKMGFETERHRPAQSYGRSGAITIDGVKYQCASETEATWLQMVCPGLINGPLAALQWQPEPFPLDYKVGKQDGRYFYKPDAIVTWDDGDEWVIEIKRGRIEQISARKMKRFCQQYEDRNLVMVWFGRMPKKGPTFRRIEMLRPWLHHIWTVK